jgi:hypothetical protein
MNNVADRISSQASPAAALDPRRCQFFFSDGRRCRQPRWQAHPALCISHANTETQLSAVPNIAADLAPLSGEFRTATDVNHVLGRLFSLLAQNRIPRRNAVALGYLAQLLLQTLPGVRDEMTRCLGYEAWDETLKSALGEAQTEDGAEHKTEAEENETEDETQDDQEEFTGWRYLQPGFGNKSGRASAAAASQPDSVSHVDEPKTVIAQTEPVPVPPPVVAAPTQTEAAHTEAEPEIATEPEPENCIPKPPEPWNYWKELEQNEHLRKMRH